MPNAVQRRLLLSGLLLCCLGLALAQSCTSCGPECVPACGSRRYRTCCFNYLRKRSGPSGSSGPPQQLQQRRPVQLELLLMPRDQEELPPGRGGPSPRRSRRPQQLVGEGEASPPAPVPAPEPAAASAEDRDRDVSREWLEDLDRDHIGSYSE